jgi:hypothetical protein
MLQYASVESTTEMWIWGAIFVAGVVQAWVPNHLVANSAFGTLGHAVILVMQGFWQN